MELCPCLAHGKIINKKGPPTFGHRQLSFLDLIRKLGSPGCACAARFSHNRIFAIISSVAAPSAQHSPLPAADSKPLTE